MYDLVGVGIGSALGVQLDILGGHLGDGRLSSTSFVRVPAGNGVAGLGGQILQGNISIVIVADGGAVRIAIQVVGHRVLVDAVGNRYFNIRCAHCAADHCLVGSIAGDRGRGYFISVLVLYLGSVVRLRSSTISIDVMDGEIVASGFPDSSKDVLALVINYDFIAGLIGRRAVRPALEGISIECRAIQYCNQLIIQMVAGLEELAIGVVAQSNLFFHRAPDGIELDIRIINQDLVAGLIGGRAIGSRRPSKEHRLDAGVVVYGSNKRAGSLYCGISLVCVFGVI